MKTHLPLLLLIFLLSACEDKHLDNKMFTSKDITVDWYKISSISTIHDYIDIKRWGYTKNILQSNTDGIYDVKINGDTITIQVLNDCLVYDLVAKTLNCYIKLDSSISYYQYYKKFKPENAKYYIGK